MGLDGHPAPPIPGRPMLRKPRRVPPRWGFPFGREAGTVQWEVERPDGDIPAYLRFTRRRLRLRWRKGQRPRHVAARRTAHKRMAVGADRAVAGEVGPARHPRGCCKEPWRPFRRTEPGRLLQGDLSTRG
jgi:hypothetical protein